MLNWAYEKKNSLFQFDFRCSAGMNWFSMGMLEATLNFELCEAILMLIKFITSRTVASSTNLNCRSSSTNSRLPLVWLRYSQIPKLPPWGPPPFRFLVVENFPSCQTETHTENVGWECLAGNQNKIKVPNKKHLGKVWRAAGKDE